jgi:hypothetical protein
LGLNAIKLGGQGVEEGAELEQGGLGHGGQGVEEGSVARTCEERKRIA